VAEPEPRPIRLVVNGTGVEVSAHPMARLLDVLRVDLGLTGTKEGCGEGECGACSVLVNGELVKIMHAPELREKLAATGTDPLTSTPEEFAAYIKREITKWGEVIRKAGVKAD